MKDWVSNPPASTRADAAAWASSDSCVHVHAADHQPRGGPGGVGGRTCLVGGPGHGFRGHAGLGGGLDGGHHGASIDRIPTVGAVRDGSGASPAAWCGRVRSGFDALGGAWAPVPVLQVSSDMAQPIPASVPVSASGASSVADHGIGLGGPGLGDRRLRLRALDRRLRLRALDRRERRDVDVAQVRQAIERGRLGHRLCHRGQARGIVLAREAPEVRLHVRAIPRDHRVDLAHAMLHRGGMGGQLELEGRLACPDPGVGLFADPGDLDLRPLLDRRQVLLGLAADGLCAVGRCGTDGLGHLRGVRRDRGEGLVAGGFGRGPDRRRQVGHQLGGLPRDLRRERRRGDQLGHGGLLGGSHGGRRRAGPCCEIG